MARVIFLSVIFGIFLSSVTPVYASDSLNLVAQMSQGAGPGAVTIAIPFLGDKSNKYYYPADCPSYKHILEENQVAFQSTSEAVKAGFSRAPDCAPASAISGIPEDLFRFPLEFRSYNFRKGETS
jgi:hypothetical protein